MIIAVQSLHKVFDKLRANDNAYTTLLLRHCGVNLLTKKISKVLWLIPDGIALALVRVFMTLTSFIISTVGSGFGVVVVGFDDVVVVVAVVDDAWLPPDVTEAGGAGVVVCRVINWAY